MWILLIGILIINISKYADNEQKQFYKFGPNDDLTILGFIINTRNKYCIVVSYCFINSVFRTLHNSILHAWLINNIQDETKNKPIEMRKLAYEITCVTTIYTWFDWFIYINILLSQIDMVLIEITADLIISVITTAYYLNNNDNQRELLINIV